MSQARLAAAPDRLPWLADEPAPPRGRKRRREGLGLAAGAAVLLIAGTSYWMGVRTSERQEPQTHQDRSSATMPLPKVIDSQPAQPQVVLEPQPQVAPAPQREVPIASPRAERPRHTIRNSAAAAERDAEQAVPVAQTPSATAAPQVAPQAAKPAPAATERPLTAWPAWQSNGATGRIVRIGAFGTRQQAKLGWQRMVRAYPAVAHLKATVVGDRNSRGRHFYRFQIGTTSQAHSEVLCQRMEKIRLSCAVVGLPWKPKGVER